MKNVKGYTYDIIDLIPLAARALVRSGKNHFLLDMTEEQGRYRDNMPERQLKKYEPFFRQQGDYGEWECEKAAALLWAADTEGPKEKAARKALFFLLSQNIHGFWLCAVRQRKFDFLQCWENYEDLQHWTEDGSSSRDGSDVPACFTAYSFGGDSSALPAYYHAAHIHLFPMVPLDPERKFVLAENIADKNQEGLTVKSGERWIDLYVMSICLNVWLKRLIPTEDVMTFALWKECKEMQRITEEERKSTFSAVQQERAAQLWKFASEEWKTIPCTLNEYLRVRPSASRILLPAEEEGSNGNMTALRHRKVDPSAIRDRMMRMISSEEDSVPADRRTALMFFETALLYCASRSVSAEIRKDFRQRMMRKESEELSSDLMEQITDQKTDGQNDLFTAEPPRRISLSAESFEALCIPLDIRKKDAIKKTSLIGGYVYEGMPWAGAVPG